MPIIQQERGARTIKGLPVRWGVRAYRELKNAMGDPLLPQSDEYARLAALLDAVTSAPIPPDATDAQLCILAEKYAASCGQAALWARNHPWPWLTEGAAVRARMGAMCKLYGVEAPEYDEDEQVNKRCQDARWWRKQVRTLHARTFEAAAIRLGWVSSRTGAYASDETVTRRIDQVRRNRAALKSVTMTNEFGQQYTLDQLADKGVGNKRIRRGELMLRLAGCEDVSIRARHAGVFVTLTAPSAYHAMLEKSGEKNPKFNLATPRETQEYLQGVWAKIRAEWARHGIKPYGFRVAEPHHDGCPHWHLLLFVPAHQVRRMQRIMRAYALEEGGKDPGAQEHRCTFERMKSERGSAAGYIAKYIMKNIEGGDSLDGHDEVNGTKLLIPDNGKSATLAQRVDAWAGVWGIRQFQPIGQPPVTVWREIRRIERAAVEDAPKNIFDAWHAAQRETATDMETGEVTVTKPANFGVYIMAQGGVNQGREYLIRLSKVDAVIEGRYGLVDGEVTTGIYCSKSPEIEYLSKRYTWTRAGGGAVFDVPRSSVNNCTDAAARFWEEAAPAPSSMAPHDDSEWWGQADFAVFEDQDYQDLVADQDERWRIIAALKKCEEHDRLMRFQ